ncbi:F-box [Glarea lozoyensis ATCC 20868]|uniref:F-box n=1 Tax=Glarea lozoyensis (strain ATCC 20868 / MF5171) TaxID=1116229 RepID=S3D4L1_GLAL2|nr:F-box [Glarea lozoyensis ATCC 20868]EPE32049.1 F-box [Glarea lozoyensis ATCC 20868]
MLSFSTYASLPNYPKPSTSPPIPPEQLNWSLSQTASQTLLSPSVLLRILHNLSPSDLLIDQRVSHLWKRLITESETLRQKLWLHLYEDPEAREWEINPFIYHIHNSQSDAIIRPQIIKLPSPETLHRSPGKICKRFATSLDFNFPAVLTACPNASWRNQTLIRPGVAFKYGLFGPGDFNLEKEVKFPASVRLGEIYDVWKEWKESWPEGEWNEVTEFKINFKGCRVEEGGRGKMVVFLVSKRFAGDVTRVGGEKVMLAKRVNGQSAQFAKSPQAMEDKRAVERAKELFRLHVGD